MFFEYKKKYSWSYSLKLLFKIVPDRGSYHGLDFDLTVGGAEARGTVDYGLEICQVYRSKEHWYDPNVKYSSKDLCIQFSVGEFSRGTGSFVPWPWPTDGKITCTLSNCDSVRKKLFFQDNWPGMKVPAAFQSPDPEAARRSDDPMLDTLDTPRTAPLKYSFVVVDDELHIEARKKKDEEGLPSTEKVANFYVSEMLGNYLFEGSEVETTPTRKLVVRHLLDSDGVGTVYLRAEEVDRNPVLSGAKYLDVEIFCDTSYDRQKEIAAVFKRAHALLVTSMTPDHFSVYMLMFASKKILTAVTRFGMQSCGLYVAGNCAWGGDLIGFRPLDQTRYSVVPKYFEELNIPIPARDFPKHMIIPFPHVRYCLGVRVWLNTMPKFFLNNIMPARATFALSVMGLHCQRFWNGESGLGHGMPFGWIYSNEPNSGKTEASLLAHSMVGFFGRPPWGGDATKPAMIERFAQQSGLSVVVDDVVLRGGESKMYSQLGRLVFDRPSRAVFGKVRTPESSPIFSSNETVNEKDVAFKTRVLEINFKALKVSKDDESVYDEWLMARELFSSLSPDFESLLFDGHLDTHALQDCASFLNKVGNRKRDRNANMCALSKCCRHH